MATIGQQLADLMADGKITDDDVVAIQAFAQFLREMPPKGEKWSRELYERWCPYIAGKADGPEGGSDVRR